MNELELKLAAAKAELEAIEAKIIAVRSAARAGHIAAVRDLMAERGLTLADLRPTGARAPKVAKTARSPARAPEYRNETGQTWGGRGKRPTWLSAALAGGRTLESFRIGA